MEALFSTFLEDKQLIDGIGSYQLRDYRSLFRAHISEMSDLSQDSLRSLRLGLSSKSPIRQRAILRNVRSFVRWCVDAGHTEPQTLSSVYLKLPRVKRQTGSVVPRETLSGVLEGCMPWFKPVVLMAINTGAGPTDLARLAASNLDGEWLNYPRQKTGVPRRIWLWPETRELLHEDGLLLRTSRGLPITVSHNRNRIGLQWRRELERLKLPKCPFYGIRRAFCVAADEAGDPIATQSVMGHAPQTTTDLYRSLPSDERLKKVSLSVHTWLSPCPCPP